MKKIIYIVRAFDTDYGFDESWTFESNEAAKEWYNSLAFEYGEDKVILTEKEEV